MHRGGPGNREPVVCRSRTQRTAQQSLTDDQRQPVGARALAGDRRTRPRRSGRSRPVSRRARWAFGGIGTLLVVGGAITCGGAAAFAASQGQITVDPATGLVKGTIVAVDGTGLPANSHGYVIECNMAPNEPTLALGSPVFDTLPIGCSPPSLKHIVDVNASGTLSTSFAILLGRKHVGPPCGFQASYAGCPRFDSKGNLTNADAQNYPCPPTPMQQVAGVTCAMVYVDASRAHSTFPISFAGGGPPVKGPPGTTGGGGGGGTPSTTVAKTPPTTKGGGGGGGKTTTTVAILTAGNHVTIPVAPVTPAVSAHLAYTGAGPGVRALAMIGAAMTLLGLLLWGGLLLRRPLGAGTR